MKFLQRCWQIAWVRRLIWSTAKVMAISALLYLWVDWTGRRQLAAVEAMLKANGETLDLRALMHEPLPESDNFCAIPLLKDLALVVDGDPTKGEPGKKRARLEAITLRRRGDSGFPAFCDASFGTRPDLDASAKWFREDSSWPIPPESGNNAGQDVLAALSKYDAVIDELALHVHRSRAQWTPEWKTRDPATVFGHYSPHTGATGGLNIVLKLRVSAAVAVGDAKKAHASALVSARLTQAHLNEPTVFAVYNGFQGIRMLYDMVWELSNSQLGTAEDFIQLELAFANFDYKQATLHALRT